MRTDFSQRFTLQYPMTDESRRNHPDTTTSMKKGGEYCNLGLPKVMNRNDSQSLDVEEIMSPGVGLGAVGTGASAIPGAGAQLSSVPEPEVPPV